MVNIRRGDITELIRTGDFMESDELEAKAARNAVPRNIWESVSAFANTYGGVIVLGLVESEGTFSVEGVQNPQQIVQDLHNHFRNSQTISTPIARPDDIWGEDIDDKQIVVVRVPRAPRNLRPIYINNNRDKVYLRRGEADCLATHTELERYRREASPQSYDRTVLEKYGISDFDKNTIRIYRDISRQLKPGLPAHQLSDEDFLRLSQAWILDRDREIEGPTVGGILMFGTQQAILDLRPRHVIDYRRIPISATPQTRWTDRVRHTGNLLNAYLEIFPRLIRSLPVPFRLEGAHRNDAPPGQDSLREAFVNLLVHTDYEEQGDALIIHSDTGFIFRNPGDSIVDPRDFGRQSSSFRRNPVVAQLFDDIGLADQAGSGFTRIFSEWQALGLGTPKPISDSVEFQFTLQLGLMSFLTDGDRHFLASLGADWTRDEAMALILAKRDGVVTNQSLREQTGLGTYEASNVLTSLRDRHILSHRGSGTNSNYFFPEPIQQLQLPESSASVSNSGDVQDESVTANWTGLNLDYDTEISQGSGLNKDFNRKKDEDSGLNSDIADAKDRTLGLNEPSDNGLAIQKVRSKKRASIDSMHQAVLLLCSMRAHSISELSVKLGRGPRQVRRYVKFLMDTEQLSTVLPNLNDPDQKYETVSDDYDDQ